MSTSSYQRSRVGCVCRIVGALRAVRDVKTQLLFVYNSFSWKLCTMSVLSLNFSLLSNGVDSTTATAPHRQSKCRGHHRQYPSWKRGTICTNNEVVILRCRTKRDASDEPNRRSSWGCSCIQWMYGRTQRN